MVVDVLPQTQHSYAIKVLLILHKTGQYCKKIKAKICDIESDKKSAYQKHLEQLASLPLNLHPRPLN